LHIKVSREWLTKKKRKEKKNFNRIKREFSHRKKNKKLRVRRERWGAEGD
jgi:hypothetical protein